MTADLKLAKATIEAEGYDTYGNLNEMPSGNDNHAFEWGYEVYGQMSIDSSAGWVAELRPVFSNGDLVDYEVVDIERID